MPRLETHCSPKYMGCIVQRKAIYDHKGKLGLDLYVNHHDWEYGHVLSCSSPGGVHWESTPLLSFRSARVIGKQLRGRFGWCFLMVFWGHFLVDAPNTSGSQDRS